MNLTFITYVTKIASKKQKKPLASMLYNFHFEKRTLKYDIEMYSYNLTYLVNLNFCKEIQHL
jgi:hypothetical protein